MDETELDLAALPAGSEARAVTLADACAAVDAAVAAGVKELTAAQADGLAGDLRAVLTGYAEEARERGEPDQLPLAELREILADVLFDDEYGEAVLEPRQHGASLEGALALADAALARLAEG